MSLRFVVIAVAWALALPAACGGSNPRLRRSATGATAAAMVQPEFRHSPDCRDHRANGQLGLFKPEPARPRFAGPVVTVTVGRPGDRWLEDMQYTCLAQGQRGGQYGYHITYDAPGGGTLTLFWPREHIDFQDAHPARFRLRVIAFGQGRLLYPDRITSQSLPRVFPGIQEIEHDHARQADGAIAAVRAFADIALMGASGPTLSTSKPFPGFSSIYTFSETGSERSFRADLEVTREQSVGLTRAEMTLPGPARAYHFMGSKKPSDIIGTTWGIPLLVSERVISVLQDAGFTGWRTYDIELFGRDGVPIPGYHGLAIHGRFRYRFAVGCTDPVRSQGNTTRLAWGSISMAVDSAHSDLGPTISNAKM